jgi:hypothetical protein
MTKSSGSATRTFVYPATVTDHGDARGQGSPKVLPSRVAAAEISTSGRIT